ncbi:MAG TPA: DUF2510 domain-containing protein [Phycicoccus elongatus]|nr:DUF2510 domain-containing protein [Phycicoccus elongatus]HRC17392.1 DUF2510 domain-containing protein [Phycicoccus elongatus]
MSAPAGWYPQPDGRQRWWDGTQWTEHYHDATAPAADAAASSEAGAATDTTAGAATGADHPYGQTAYGQATYGQPGQATYGQPGQATYGQPGTSPGAPSSGSGVGKGCLIAAAIVAVLVALMVVAGIVLFNTAKKKVEEVIPTTFPTSTSGPGLPGLPTLPGSDGAEATATVGEAFTLGELSFQSGWSIGDDDSFGTGTITGLTTDAPVESAIIDVSVMNGAQELDTTYCTVESGTTKFSCLPFFEDLTGATEVVFRRSL